MAILHDRFLKFVQNTDSQYIVTVDLPPGSAAWPGYPHRDPRPPPRQDRDRPVPDPQGGAAGGHTSCSRGPAAAVSCGGETSCHAPRSCCSRGPRHQTAHPARGHVQASAAAAALHLRSCSSCRGQPSCVRRGCSWGGGRGRHGPADDARHGQGEYCRHLRVLCIV